MNAEEKRETIRAALLLYAVTDRSWVGKQTFTEQVKDSLEGGVLPVEISHKVFHVSRSFLRRESRKVLLSSLRSQV